MIIYTGKLVRDRSGKLVFRPNDGFVPARYRKGSLHRINPALWPNVKSVTFSGEIMQPIFMDAERNQLRFQTVFNYVPDSGERISYYHVHLAAGTYHAEGWLSHRFTSDSSYSVFGITCPRAQYASDHPYWSGEWFVLPFVMTVDPSGQVYVNGIDCGIHPF